MVKECCHSFNDHLSLKKNCQLQFHMYFYKMSGILAGHFRFFFLIFQDFSSLEIYFYIFKVFQVSGNPVKLTSNKQIFNNNRRLR